MKTNTNNITAVLLADGWHDVNAGTFIVDRMRLTHAGADVYPPPEDAGEPWFGFTDSATQDHIAGPMAHLLAVRVATA